MVIGSISFTSTRQTPINQLNTNSFLNNDLVNQANSSVASASQKAAGKLPVASDKSFSINMQVTTYVDPNNGQLYAAGSNYHGNMGLGYDEKGNGIRADQHTFTPLFKSGDKSQPFINPIDWSFGGYHTGIIDADGKLWTAGSNYYGSVGNGDISIGDSTTHAQWTFEMVEINGSYDYTAVKVVANTTPTIVLLDNGDIYGAGDYRALGLSATGGYKLDADGNIVEGGGYYPTFVQIDNTSEEDAISYEMPFDTSEIVDIKVGGNMQILYLLEDGSLYRCNSSGYALVSTDVVSFDSLYHRSYYVTSNGDVYYGSGETPILTADDYEGTIDSVYTQGHNTGGWAYLTTTGDVYYTNTATGTDFNKIAQDVIYFDMGGYNADGAPTFGAITKDGQFKLWGTDARGMLGNGENEGATPNWDPAKPDSLLDAFLSDEANPSTPTTDGNNVVVPNVDEEGKVDPSNPIIPTLASPAPA